MATLPRAQYCVPPTDVRNGHAAGNCGMKRVDMVPSLDSQARPGPASPLEKMTDTPRAASCAKRLQVLIT